MSLALKTILEYALPSNPSDIHLSVGVAPVCRINGQLVSLPLSIISQQDIEGILHQFLNETQLSTFKSLGEIDIALPDCWNYNIRMRLNAFKQKGNYSIALRILQQTIPSFEQLGLDPNIMQQLCGLKRGLVLVTGATGSGKTTTINSMVDWINKNRASHIITIEDPVEYYHNHDKSIVHQREYGTDTKDYSTALKAALRQDPDVLVIGEMRDLESISMAITAAETGHLVLSTLHTISADKSIDRIIDSFPVNQQQQIRLQMSMALQGVISQQLVPSINNDKRILANEVMLTTPAISNLIRDNKTNQIKNSIITSSSMGMCTMDMRLVKLAKQGKISVESAISFSQDRNYVSKLIADN